MASIAVPRFTSVTTAANTAKIQSDLTTIDTAISIYYMEKGSYPSTIDALSDYLRDASNVKPPKGKAYVNGTATEISASTYAIRAATTTDEARATLDNKTAGEFTNTKKTGTSGDSSGGT